MNKSQAENIIRLFGMSTLQIKSSLNAIEKEYQMKVSFSPSDDPTSDQEYYPQLDFEIRQKAKRMAIYYEVFYCLENTIRSIVREEFIKKFGEEEWWEKAVDQKIREDVETRIQRDLDSSFTVRSEDYLDFANFGELTSIIEKQWDCFDDLFKSKKALKRVLTSLNTLRGPIAHCCELAEDEVKRLELTIKDLFRLMS